MSSTPKLPVLAVTGFLHGLLKLVRINLSEQTDISDLFGSDLPVPGPRAQDRETELEDQDMIKDGGGSGSGVGSRAGSGNGSGDGSGDGSGGFSWCDGVFLSALKAGKWVLLDELNLASQVSCGIRCRISVMASMASPPSSVCLKFP